MARYREFICVYCGQTDIDNSPTQSRRFCSDHCRNAFHYTRRTKPVETVCLYNDGVECATHNCTRCGFNPEVEEKRKGQAYARYTN